MTQNNENAEKSTEQSTETVNKNIREKANRLLKLALEVGAGWRWYDIPIRLLEWWLKSWRLSIVPSLLRRLLVRGINFLSVFKEYDLSKSEALDDLMDNLIIPEEVELRQCGVWTIELFPPSQFKSLERAFQRNGLNRSPFQASDETTSQQVRRAREGRGFSWSLIGTISRSNSKHMLPAIKHENLPEEFEYIKITAIQLGTSVTAVVTFFQFSDVGASSLDRIWRGSHEPTLTWNGFRRPRVANRYFAAIEATQHERMRIHNLARSWSSKLCPGFFASRRGQHPVLDLNLFNGFDPLLKDGSNSMRHAMRALGLEGWELEKNISTQMKGTTLIPSYRRNGPHECIKNCWSIAGEYRRVIDENKRSSCDVRSYSAKNIGHVLGDAASAFLLHLAVNAYLSEKTAFYALSRDLASTRHKRFKAKKARRLSSEILESGLDLPAVARDSRHLSIKRWYLDIEVQSVPSSKKRENFESFDLIESFNKSREKRFQQLIEQDESYRNVLSTVAALGASADAVWTGKIALVVAAGSMIVATITLLITQTSETSLLSSFVKWLG